MALTLVLILFLHGLCESDALLVKGKEGRQINITCSQANAESKMKYFCRDKCRNEDVLITSSETNKHSNGRYRLEDKGNIFFVIISDLTIKDSGTYWCGVDRVGWDDYTEVSIIVEEDKKDTAESWAMNTKASFPRKRIYIGAWLGIFLVVLAMVLLKFAKHQRRFVHSSSAGKNPETIYTTPSFKKEDGNGNHDIPASLAVEHRETTCRTKYSTEHIYSNVSPQPQNQTAELIYSTVSFVKCSDVSSTI